MARQQRGRPTTGFQSWSDFRHFLSNWIQANQIFKCLLANSFDRRHELDCRDSHQAQFPHHLWSFTHIKRVLHKKMLTIFLIEPNMAFNIFNIRPSETPLLNGKLVIANHAWLKH